MANTIFQAKSFIETENKFLNLYKVEFNFTHKINKNLTRMKIYKNEKQKYVHITRVKFGTTLSLASIITIFY